MRHVVIPVNVGHCIKTLIWNINMPLRELSIIYFTDIIQSWLQSNPRKFCSIVNRLKTHEMQLCNEQGDMVPSRECCVIFQNLFVTLFANDVLCLGPHLQRPVILLWMQSLLSGLALRNWYITWNHLLRLVLIESVLCFFYILRCSH